MDQANAVSAEVNGESEECCSDSVQASRASSSPFCVIVDLLFPAGNVWRITGSAVRFGLDFARCFMYMYLVLAKKYMRSVL
uniref:Uncharacterized protein n=1 Tax=Syphacia muris TaxID=451379 RepID=A0A0N5ANP8_9BILA